VGDTGQIVVEHLPNASVVSLHGEHDVASLPAVEAALDELLDQGTSVVFDLSQASFIDSSTVGATLRGHHATKPARVVAVAATPGTEPRRILDLVELTVIIPVFDSLQDAIASAHATRA
jgi:anti-sigma B factor antagonist